MVIEIPKEWKCVCTINKSLGTLYEEPCELAPDAPVIYIKGKNNLGSITIEKI